MREFLHDRSKLDGMPREALDVSKLNDRNRLARMVRRRSCRIVRAMFNADLHSGEELHEPDTRVRRSG